MKTKIIALAISALFLWMSCGAEEEQIPTEPAAVEEEVVKSAAELLERGQRQVDGGNLHDAVGTLKVLLENYPDGDEAPKAKELLKKAEEGLASRLQAQRAEELLAGLLKVSEGGYDYYYDPTVYEMESSKVYLVLRQSGSGESSIRLVVDHYHNADQGPLGVKRFTMMVGHQPFPIIPRANELTTKTVGDKVIESLDTRPVFMHRGMIEAIITTDKVVLVAEGEDRNEERELGSEEKQGLEHVLAAITAIGGIW